MLGSSLSADGPRVADLRVDWWWVVMVVVVGALTRAVFLDQPMRQDEADTVVMYALTPVSHILVDTEIPNNHILHTLLVRGSIAAFGLETWVVRLPAYLFGVLLIPLTFLVGKAFYNATAGLVGAAIAAVSTPLLLYATNARGYSMIACATLVSLLALERALATNQWRFWLGFAAVGAAGAFVNPTMLYPMGGMVGWAALELLTRRPFARSEVVRLATACAACTLLAVLAYVPAIAVSGWRSVAGNSFVRPLAWDQFLANLPGFFFRMGAYPMTGWPTLLVLMVVGAMLAGVVWHQRVARHRWSVALAMLSWAVLLLVITRRDPSLRVWLYLVPVFFVVAGAGITTVLGRGARRSPTIVGLVVSLVTIALGWRAVDSRAPDLLADTGVFRGGLFMAERLMAELAPGDLVASKYRIRGPVDFYLRRAGVQARFARPGDSVTARVFVLIDHLQEDTAESVLTFRKVRGFDLSRAREIARFERSALWVVPGVLTETTKPAAAPVP